MNELDRDLFLWIVDHRVGWLDPIFVALSVAGYAGLVWIALATALAAWSGRSILPMTVVTAMCVWGADLITLALKAATGRSRPFETIAEPEPLLTATVGSSFPSGHAATSFAGAVILGYLTPRAVAALAVLAMAIAFSRTYVGVHYPSDVVVGAAIGATVSVAAAAALRSRLRPSTGPRGSVGRRRPG